MWCVSGLRGWERSLQPHRCSMRGCRCSECGSYRPHSVAAELRISSWAPWGPPVAAAALWGTSVRLHKMGLGTGECGLSHFHTLQQWRWISAAPMKRPCGYKTKLLFCIESFSSSAHLQWFEGYIATHQSGIPLAQKHGCALHAQKCSSWGWEGCRTHKALEDCRDGRALKLMQTVLGMCLASWHGPGQFVETAKSPVRVAFRSWGLFGPL